MGALGYVIRRSVINYIKALKKKPGQLVAYLVFLAMIVLMFTVSADNQFDQQWLSNEVRSVVFAGLPLLALYFTVSNGLKKGSTFFRMADVNYVFPSPIDRRSILIYGFIRQLGISLFVLLYLLFQISNIRNLFGVPHESLWLFFLTVLTAVLYMPVCSMIIHAAVLKRPHMKTLYNRLFLGGFGLLGAAFVVLLIRSQDPAGAAYSLVGGPAFGYIPIIGWLKVLLEASVTGFTTYSILSSILLVGGLGGLVWYLLSSDIDYFEEVLMETERKERLIQDKRAGKAKVMRTNKVRKAKSFYKGGGTSAIFYRQLLEYRKSGFFLLDKSSILLVVIGLAMAYLLRNNPMRMEYMLYASIYLLFILSMSGRWGDELDSYYIYLIPGKPLKKLWYATLINHIKHVFDGLLLFVVAGQVFGTPLIHRLLLAGCYGAFGALYVYGEVLFRRIFGSTHENFVAAMLKLLSVMILSIPALVLVVVGAVIAKGSITIIGLSYMGVIIYTLLASFLVMLLGRRIFATEG